MTENFSEQLLQHDGDIMNKLDTEQYKSFSQILENPDEENLNKWLEDNLTNNVSGISAISSTLNDSFFGPLSPFRESKFNNNENFQVLLSIQEHINDQVSDNQHFADEVEKALGGEQDDFLKFMHAVTILWKTALHGPGETPRFSPEVIKNKLTSIDEVDEEVSAFLLDRLIVNILWPQHRDHVDNLSIEEIEDILHSFTVQNFSDESLNYFAKTYFFHYFKEGDERVVGLRDAAYSDEFSNGFTNYLIASRLDIDDVDRTPMLLRALSSFIETNDQQRQSAILTRLMKAGVDTKREDGSYTQTTTEDGPLQRMISILQVLDPDTYSEQVINSVVNEIVEYMMYRIQKNNQQSMSNRFHPGNQRFEIDDLDRLDVLHDEAQGYDRIMEIVGILQLIRDGKTEIASAENPLFERWLDEIINHERVLSVYSVDNCDVDEIIFAALGCLLHSASNHLNDSSAGSIISELRIQLNSRKDAFTDDNMKNFVDLILDVIDEVTSFDRASWREKLNDRLKQDLQTFILDRNITKEQLVYAVELHRSMISNEEIHPNQKENFYQVFLFMEYIVDEFGNESQYPKDLVDEFHSMRSALHMGLTAYIEAITSDNDIAKEHAETFGFTLERLEEIQGKLLPKEE